MVDMVQVARRRKLAAAQVVGDVQRITILRGMMTAETPEEEVAPEEAPAAEEIEVPEEAPEVVEEVIEPPSDEGAIETTDPTTGDE